MIKLNIPNFCFVNTKCKKSLSEKLSVYFDQRSPYLSSVAQCSPRPFNLSHTDETAVVNLKHALKEEILLAKNEKQKGDKKIQTD